MCGGRQAHTAARQHKGFHVANILIVDDEDIFTEFAGRTLKAAGHTVTMTTSPRVAIEFATTDVPDLVISDINMPQMTGFELAAILNADSARPGRRSSSCPRATTGSLSGMPLG